MLSLEEYLKNPCRQSSLPYWKVKSLSLGNDIKIIHNSDYLASTYINYTDERYFRFIHHLEHIDKTELVEFYVETAKEEQDAAIVSIINQSYEDLQVDIAQMKGYRNTDVYRPDLWIIVKENDTNTYVGCGIADYDSEAKEGILEWIQVLPEYRGKGIGQAIVNELLRRMQDMAEFVTVSGQVDNPSNPEKLYRKCGFRGDDVWHVLRKRVM